MNYEHSLSAAAGRIRDKEVDRPRRSFAFRNLVGESDAIARATELGSKVAQHPTTTVLIRGETGTGKELFARGIHYSGAASGAPFVAINCAAIPENLLESELFGHEKGAFTGAEMPKEGLLELAGSGTVFLDEISELPPNLQPKLLRVVEEKRVRRLGGLQEREISCRIVAASNRDLATAVSDGHFREDLFYRLSVFQVELPPLRYRAGDIDLLSSHFVDVLCRERGIPQKSVTQEAAALLRGHNWPGNIRELKNTIERAIILSETDAIEPEQILLQQRSSVPAAEAARSRDAVAVITVPPEGLTLEDVERQLLEITLRLTNHNQSRTARMLGISRPTIIRKIRKYHLDS
ncbi:MAG: sigma-54 dependent transcriptional regulator [Gemmatimonadota bacterium]